MKSPAPSIASSGLPSKQLAAFIAKFDANVAKLIRACRTELRELLPPLNWCTTTTTFFVIGYASTKRGSDAIISVAAASNGVGLCFLHGASLPDPMLGGSKETRFLR
jgi:hypothetical protein